MKFLFLLFSSLLCISGFSQIRKISGPHFIESIELNRDISNGSQVDKENLEPQKPVVVSEKSQPQIESSGIETYTSIQFKYALLTNREVESINDVSLYDFIDHWMNTPYRMGGTSKSGIDCSGFALTLASSVYGANLPRTAKAQYNATARVSRNELQEGDLVFFNTRGGVSHVGVYLGNDYFVHSSTRQGVIISSLNDSYYNIRFLGGGRRAELHEADSLSMR